MRAPHRSKVSALQPLAHLGLQFGRMRITHRVHELRRMRGERIANLPAYVAHCGAP